MLVYLVLKITDNLIINLPPFYSLMLTIIIMTKVGIFLSFTFIYLCFYHKLTGNHLKEAETEKEAAEEILHQKASNVTSFLSLINPTQLKVNVDGELNESKEVSSDEEMPPMPVSLLRTSNSKQVNGKNLKLLPVTCEKMNSYKYEKNDRDPHTTHPSALVNAVRVLPPFESVKFSKKKTKEAIPTSSYSEKYK